MKNAHSELVNKTLLSIGATAYCRVWKNHVGAAVPLGALKMLSKKHGGMIPYSEVLRFVIHYGQVGSADIIGIMKNGKFVAIECKTGSGKQSKVQVNFEKMINAFNGVYMVVREQDPALQWILQHSGE